MKHNRLLISIACIGMLLSSFASCANKEPIVNKHPETKPDKPLDDKDDNLPEPGAKERYSPSAKNTYYYPIELEISTSNTAAESRTWKPAKARVLNYMADFTPDETIDTYKSKTNKYGSSTELPKQTATGRFYVKKIDGRWWIVDPEGYLHHHRGVNSIRPGTSADNLARFNKKFASIQTWMIITNVELRNIGFHGAGAFSKDYYADFITYNNSQGTPYILTPSFGFLARFKEQKVGSWPGNDSNNKAGLILHKDWESWCKQYVKTDLAPYKNDPHTLGIFSDNEIYFTHYGTGEDNRIIPRLLKTTGYTYDATKQWCVDNGIDPNNTSQIRLMANNYKFAAYLAEKYYKAVSEAIKSFDPGMLYLGSRLHGEPRLSKEVWAAAGKYCDIISVNYYGDWSADLVANDGERVPGKASRGHALLWETWSGGKPFLVTEFYTKGIEDSQLNNMSGAGFAVKNEAARAYAYQHFTLGLLEAPNCVGWHWFKYQDDEPEDNDNMGANKGIYDRNFTMFPYLGRYMKELNVNVSDLIKYFDDQK